MQVRKPAVAGMFYPSNKDELLSTIRECFLNKLGPGSFYPNESKSFIAFVSPHAGYMYSGPVAAYTYCYASLVKPELVILVGPNHYGLGSSVASMKDAVWDTPLGSIEVDNEAVDIAVKVSGIIDIDFYAHIKEHSIEVQLPMLQFIYKHNYKILPIILWMQDQETAKDVGRAIAEVAKKKSSLIIASSDFTHYEPNDVAYKKDRELINTVEELDTSRFYTILERLKVSACGYGAIASVMYASKLLGAKSAKLLKYATSGDVTGDMDSVVGYASIMIS